MTASFFRQRSPTPIKEALKDSRDALDIAGEILEGAADVKQIGSILFDYPADDGARKAVRKAAQKIIADCDALERLVR